MKTKKIVIASLIAGVLAVGTIAAPATAATSAGEKHLTAKLTADDHIVVDWLSTTGAKYYKVRTSSTPDMSQDIKTYKVSKAHTDFTIDATASRYAYAKPSSGNYVFVRVYVVKTNGTVGTSPYKRIRLHQLAVNAAASKITVATYNVRTAEDDVKGHSWASRKKAVAGRIKDANASVVAIEEAGDHFTAFKKIITVGADGKKHKTRDYDWQFEQLRDAVGGSYALTNTQEYSLGEGKEGTRILYDTSKVTLLAQGDFAPSAVSAKLRYVPWARFQDNATGKTFYFIAAHLDNRKDTGKSHTFYNLRIKQAKTIISKARGFAASGEQVILAGDLNSNIYSTPTNGADRTLIAAGFIDAYSATSNVNAYHETFSDYHVSKVSASRTDYIMTFGRSDLGGPTSYKNWTSKSNGIYASDHNMQSAVVPF
jgi:endonuclease/exonuclease/phosphatase family metal-dependent hydrolase